MLDRNKLDLFATKIRLETIKAIGHIGFGHVGGSMSIADLLAVLYGEAMKFDAKNPGWEERDWLVVSKGHSGPAVYAALALSGFFDIGLLKTLNQPNTSLPSHCDRNKTPGIDITTGSLGQGLSAAVGVALGHKILKRANLVYAIVGDGECNEGQIWEAVLFAAHHKLDNLILFIDYNKEQIDGTTMQVMGLDDIVKKFEAFNWNTGRIDGHDVMAISSAIKNIRKDKERPSVVILDTIKGKGCLCAEGKPNHHMRLKKEEIDASIKVFEEKIKNLEMKIKEEQTP